MPIIRSLALATPLALAASALAADYDLFQLPHPPGPGWDNLFPTDMNDNGHVIGIHMQGFWFMPRGFCFNGEVNIEFGQDLKDSQPYEDWAMGIRPLRINNHNHILLNLEVVDVGVFPYLWDGDEYTPLEPPIPPGNHDFADAGIGSLNNSGQFAGAFRFITSNPMNLWYRGFIWDRDTNAVTIIEPTAPFTDRSEERV